MLLSFPFRTQRPRTVGMNCLIDPGLALGLFRDTIESHGHMVDCVKFGWGTSLVTKDIDEKIAVLRAHSVDYCFGGSLFEKMFHLNKVDEYKSWCSKKKCPIVEISDGTLEIPHEVKARHIADFAKDFTVYSEVGYKDSERSIKLAPSKWIESIQSDLAAGSRHVITEARETGTSGICRSDGELRFGLIEDMITSGIQTDRLIFEAPNKTLQVFFIKRLGSNVNLANIAFSDIIGVETLRLGLRSDTLTFI